MEPCCCCVSALGDSEGGAVRAGAAGGAMQACRLYQLVPEHADDGPSAQAVGWLAAGEGGERTSNFSKPAALRGPRIAFGLTFTTPSGVRSTPGTTGRGAPLP